MSTDQQDDKPVNAPESTTGEPPSGEASHGDNAEIGFAEEAAARPTGETHREENHELEALRAELATQREEVLRAHAEMQNLRKRAERDVENAHKFALERFVGELVSVVDNLERATAAIDTENPELTVLGEGVELTLKGLLDLLQRFNVSQVDPQGEPFDPEKHQAMTTVPSPGVAPNTVIDVFQKGYLLNGRLVRPAMVVVSQG